MTDKLSTTTKAYRIRFDSKTADLNSAIEALKELAIRNGCAQCGRLGFIDAYFEERINPREIAGVKSIVDLHSNTEIG